MARSSASNRRVASATDNPVARHDGRARVKSFSTGIVARREKDLAARHQSDALYGDALFEANVILGKMALRRGDKKAAARDLLAAAGTPGSDRIRRGEFEMNLPRSLVDWGERRAVAEFFERMAPKTVRSKQFQDWAAEILKGVNPDLIPTLSFPGCSQDPC